MKKSKGTFRAQSRYQFSQTFFFKKFDETNTPRKVIERRKRTYRRRLAKAREEGEDIDKDALKKELGLDAIIVEDTQEEEEELGEDEMPAMPSFDF